MADKKNIDHKSKLKTYLTVLLFLMPFMVFSQEGPTNSPLSNDKNQQKAEKKKLELLEKQRLAEEKGKERHMKIQTKETRKRMKKSAKKSRKTNERREEFFLKKLFSK